MSLRDKLLEKYRIDLNDLKDGQQKTKCPECQPKHKPSDNPLSVEVNADSVLLKCHHCGLEGAVFRW